MILTTVITYYDWINCYGMLSILMLLEKLENSNEYEECIKLRDAVSKACDQHKIDYPKRLTPSVKIDLIENAFKYNFKLPNVLATSERNLSVIVSNLKQYYKIEL